MLNIDSCDNTWLSKGNNSQQDLDDMKKLIEKYSNLYLSEIHSMDASTFFNLVSGNNYDFKNIIDGFEHHKNVKPKSIS